MTGWGTVILPEGWLALQNPTSVSPPPPLASRHRGGPRSSGDHERPAAGCHAEAAAADALLSQALLAGAGARLAQRTGTGDGVPAPARPGGRCGSLRAAGGARVRRERRRRYKARAGPRGPTLALPDGPASPPPRQLGRTLSAPPASRQGGTSPRLAVVLAGARGPPCVWRRVGPPASAWTVASDTPRAPCALEARSRGGADQRNRPEGRRTYCACTALRATRRQSVTGERRRWAGELFPQSVKPHRGLGEGAPHGCDAVLAQVHWG
jgi:hypothetical protein